MLGNVKPYMPALSYEAKNRYNSFYCGLCKALGRQNGISARFMLNYDMALVAMIYDELHGEEYTVRHTGCFANPFKKKDILNPTKGTAFAADVLIMLAYFKLMDNIRDEAFLKKLGCIALLPYLYTKFSKVKRRNYALAEILQRENLNQQVAEKACTDTDSVARPTAMMVKAILTECANKENKFAAGQFGFFLGRVIYLLDALNDRKDDLAGGKFNIFNINNISDEAAKAECFMALGEMAHWYNHITFKQNKEITDNIIYMSLARSIKFAGEEKEENNGK